MSTHKTMLKLVGHRGLFAAYPENTIVSLEQAILAGADAIEFDVQFTADRQPILVHDANFERVANNKERAEYLDYDTVKTMSVHEPARFADQFFPCAVPDLADVVNLLRRYPKVKAFFEFKDESFLYVSRSDALAICWPQLDTVRDQIVFISFDYEVLALIKIRYSHPVGWVIKHYDHESKIRAEQLKPQVLICNYRKFLGQDLWQGPWQWFAYDVVDIDLARKLISMGVEWIESKDVRLLADLRK